jgi:hypothetical protein
LSRQGKLFRVSTLAIDWRLVAYISLSDEVPCAPFTCPNWVPARLHARYRWRFGVAARWRQNKWKTCQPTSTWPCARYRRGPRRRQDTARVCTDRRQQEAARAPEIHSRPASCDALCRHPPKLAQNPAKCESFARPETRYTHDTRYQVRCDLLRVCCVCVFVGWHVAPGVLVG